MQNTPYGIAALWQQGDIVIKAVAILLLIMSIVSWTIMLVRVWRLWRQYQHSRLIPNLWLASTNNKGAQGLGPNHAANLYRQLFDQGNNALQHHCRHHDALQGQLPLADWLNASLGAAIDEFAERFQRGLPVLASVAATAPFIGLFGTVWGIYHALVNISVSGQSSIEQVAGPVGESLIMTAFGLAVAIPAVLGHNMLLRGNKNLLGRLNRFAHQLHAYLLTGLITANGLSQNIRKVEAEIA